MRFDINASAYVFSQAGLIVSNFVILTDFIRSSLLIFQKAFLGGFGVPFMFLRSLPLK